MEIKKTVSDLRGRYDEIAELCRGRAEAVIITRGGKDELAVMSAGKYRRLKKSLDDLNKQLDAVCEQIGKIEKSVDALSIMEEGQADLKNRVYGIDKEFDRIVAKFRKNSKTNSR